VIFSPGLRKEFFACGSAAHWGGQFWPQPAYRAGAEKAWQKLRQFRQHPVDILRADIKVR
jgi:hypothetical protein